MMKRLPWQRIIILLLLGSLLIGCAVSGATGAQAAVGAIGWIETTVSQDEPTPGVLLTTGSQSTETYGKSQVDYLTTVAIQDLSQRLGIEASRIAVASVSPRQFSDSSLGLPQPDRAYAQVITPGYIIQLKVDDTLYRYHGSERRAIYGGLMTVPAKGVPLPNSAPSASKTELRAITLAFSTDPGSSLAADSIYVERMVDSADVTPGVALEMLFRGPTEAERTRGANSCFTIETQSLYHSVRIQARTAYLDLNNPRSLLAELATEDGLARFDAQVLQTLQGVSDVERVIYAIEGDPVAFYRWLGLDCGSENGYCDAGPFQPTPVPLTQASPTAPAERVTGINLHTVLGDGVVVLRQTTADLDGDGFEELLILSDVGLAGADAVGNRLELSVVQPKLDGSPVVWQVRTRGLTAEPFEVRDLNGDGQPEVLSAQSVGEARRVLYVVTWGNAGYDLLRPFGGQFDGYDAFGERDFGLEDSGGDGLVEILGVYGASGSRIDAYRWNGQRYVYATTDDYAY